MTSLVLKNEKKKKKKSLYLILPVIFSKNES